MSECHLTQEEVAAKVGKERSTVANFLRLLKLPPKIKEGLRKGVVSMGHARAIINLPTEKEQLRLFEKIVRSGYSVRTVEQIARTKKPAAARKREIPAEVHHVEGKLREALGTKVHVRSKGKGKGEIVIEFFSLDDLDRLLDLLTGR
jgi:ParB family chromosome partitioning protein